MTERPFQISYPMKRAADALPMTGRKRRSTIKEADRGVHEENGIISLNSDIDPPAAAALSASAMPMVHSATIADSDGSQGHQWRQRELADDLLRRPGVAIQNNTPPVVGGTSRGASMSKAARPSKADPEVAMSPGDVEEVRDGDDVRLNSDAVAAAADNKFGGNSIHRCIGVSVQDTTASACAKVFGCQTTTRNEVNRCLEDAIAVGVIDDSGLLVKELTRERKRGSTFEAVGETVSPETYHSGRVASNDSTSFPRGNPITTANAPSSSPAFMDDVFDHSDHRRVGKKKCRGRPPKLFTRPSCHTPMKNFHVTSAISSPEVRSIPKSPLMVAGEVRSKRCNRQDPQTETPEVESAGHHQGGKDKKEGGGREDWLVPGLYESHLLEEMKNRAECQKSLQKNSTIHPHTMGTSSSNGSKPNTPNEPFLESSDKSNISLSYVAQEQTSTNQTPVILMLESKLNCQETPDFPTDSGIAVHSAAGEKVSKVGSPAVIALQGVRECHSNYAAETPGLEGNSLGSMHGCFDRLMSVRGKHRGHEEKDVAISSRQSSSRMGAERKAENVITPLVPSFVSIVTPAESKGERSCRHTPKSLMPQREVKNSKFLNDNSMLVLEKKVKPRPVSEVLGAISKAIDGDTLKAPEEKKASTFLGRGNSRRRKKKNPLSWQLQGNLESIPEINQHKDCNDFDAFDFDLDALGDLTGETSFGCKETESKNDLSTIDVANTSGGVDTPVPIPPARFKEKQYIFAIHGDSNVYEAVVTGSEFRVLQGDSSNKTWFYQVQFFGQNSSQNLWVREFEICQMEEKYKKQFQVKMNRSKQSKKENRKTAKLGPSQESRSNNNKKDVEEIIGQRESVEHGVEYLISWVGYAGKTWEPESHLSDKAISMVKEFCRRHGLVVNKGRAPLAIDCHEEPPEKLSSCLVPSPDKSCNVVDNFNEVLEAKSSCPKEKTGSSRRGEEAQGIPGSKRTVLKSFPFLTMLVQMLEDKNFRDIIEWKGGKIHIHKPRQIGEVFVKHSRITRIVSFIGQLRRFGFKKVTGARGILSPCSFYNEMTTHDIKSIMKLTYCKSIHNKQVSPITSTNDTEFNPARAKQQQTVATLGTISQMPIEEINPTKKVVPPIASSATSKSYSLFPSLLVNMLEDDKNCHVIEWKSGKLYVHNTEGVLTILKKHTRMTDFMSFHRQLNHFGFSKGRCSHSDPGPTFSYTNNKTTLDVQSILKLYTKKKIDRRIRRKRTYIGPISMGKGKTGASKREIPGGPSNYLTKTKKQKFNDRSIYVDVLSQLVVQGTPLDIDAHHQEMNDKEAADKLNEALPILDRKVINANMMKDFQKLREQITSEINSHRPLELFFSMMQENSEGHSAEERQRVDTIRSALGHEKFRHPQAEVCMEVLKNRSDIVFISPTGHGKSLCFILPSLVKGNCTNRKYRSWPYLR